MIRLDDLEVYKTARAIGEITYNAVLSWHHFDKSTLGTQLIRAADSVALNIAEGYGRYFFKENRQFCYYSRGSAYETVSCLKKAYERRLITEAQYLDFKINLERFLKLLNAYIKSIGSSGIKDQ